LRIIHIKPYRFLGEFQVISAWERRDRERGDDEETVRVRRVWCRVTSQYVTLQNMRGRLIQQPQTLLFSHWQKWFV